MDIPKPVRILHLVASTALLGGCVLLVVVATTSAAVAHPVGTAAPTSAALSTLEPPGMGWQAAQATEPLDYSRDSAWLCRPGRDDVCAEDLAATVVHADGTLARTGWRPNPAAPIDCFYVYPTVSTDSSTYSDTTPDEAERRVVRQQFARFAEVCRPFAPYYRQVTLAGLRARLAGDPGENAGLSEGIGYEDVRAAFRHYLENDNDGRGFVLVGHSQGSWVLQRLIREEVEGQAVEDQLVSAILAGATFAVPEGEDVGGTLQSTPLCRSSEETGCVIAYYSFRATAPPPENTLFGSVPQPGLEAACTNPANLMGGIGELDPYLPTSGTTIVGTGGARVWAQGAPEVETAFVNLPGLMTAECATNEHATYLEVTVHGDPSDPRTDDIGGDLTPQWGLHLVDMGLAQGNLIDIVDQQSAAWRSERRTSAVGTGWSAGSRSSSGEWEAPRTLWGDPDLQGNWTNATLTPIQRMPGTDEILTPEQVAAIEGQRTQLIEEQLQPSDPDREAPPVGGTTIGDPLFDAAAGGTGGYNIQYIEAGRQVARFNGEPRSSLVVRPDNGRIPQLTDHARRVLGERNQFRSRFDEYDHVELRSLSERCIKSFGSNAGPPMLPNYFYNNNYTIVQSPDHVMIMTEMVHDARIIHLEDDVEPPPDDVHLWYGFSRGHWEGDTLVVETTHVRQEQLFDNMTYYPGGSKNYRVVERFTRADDDTINYEFTVVDPDWYTAEWGGQVPMERRDALLYEYACHEANHSLFGVLSGARAQERRAEEGR